MLIRMSNVHVTVDYISHIKPRSRSVNSTFQRKTATTLRLVNDSFPPSLLDRQIDVAILQRIESSNFLNLCTVSIDS
jgi:hypothetical protein